MSQKFLIALDRQEMPGHIILTFVSLETEIISPRDAVSFRERKFMLIGPNHPLVEWVKEMFP
jgi:hypothetical protein